MANIIRSLFLLLTINYFSINFVKSESPVLQEKFFTPCQTPDMEHGLCGEIQKCAPLFEAMTNGKLTSFINQSRCGPSNEDITQFKVCCPLKIDYGKKDDSGKMANKIKINNVLPKKCGMQGISLANRIVGGTEAELGEFPWMARLEYKNNETGRVGFGCTGFIIHRKYILTAAHCVNSNFAAKVGPLYQVVLGEHDDRTTQDCTHDKLECAPPIHIVLVDEAIIHPLYNKSAKNNLHDIALVALKKAVKMTDYIHPICLFNKSPKTEELYLSGWGTTETSTVSNIKLKVSVPRVTHEVCSKAYQKVNRYITENQICAGTENKDSCQGDSGGPLMAQNNTDNKWYAEGIVSFGLGCGDKTFPGVYTYIPNYIQWILDEISKRESNIKKSRKN